ncbi:MAG: hypothetical protein H0V89_09115 [Deltaproteobacteria bacterium]|nr:hypothetical protein [Deltaproteobacteria bacterium]
MQCPIGWLAAPTGWSSADTDPDGYLWVTARTAGRGPRVSPVDVATHRLATDADGFALDGGDDDGTPTDFLTQPGSILALRLAQGLPSPSLHLPSRGTL